MSSRRGVQRLSSFVMPMFDQYYHYYHRRLLSSSFVIVVVLLSSSFSSCRPCSWFLETESCNYFRVETLQEFECQDYSRVKAFRIDWCGNYFGVKTYCRSLGVGTFLRSRPSYLFECCNYFGVKTSCRNFSFAIRVNTLRWKLRVRISHGWIAEVGLRDFLRV